MQTRDEVESPFVELSEGKKIYIVKQISVSDKTRRVFENTKEPKLIIFLHWVMQKKPFSTLNNREMR